MPTRRWPHWQQVVDAEPAAAIEHRLHALNNSARLLEQQRRYPEAETLMRRSLQLKAAQFDVIQHLVHIRQKQCAWPHDAPVGEVTPNQFLLGTSLLATMGLSDDPALQLLAATRFVHERVAKAAGRAATAPWLAAAGRAHQGRLPVGRPAHPRRRPADAGAVRTARPRPLRGPRLLLDTRIDAARRRLRLLKAFDHHVRLAGVDDHTAARLIAQAGIDVLVDLQGLTQGARRRSWASGRRRCRSVGWGFRAPRRCPVSTGSSPTVS